MNYSAEQLALKELLESKKAEMEAWVAEDPNHRWGGYATTDLDHWESYGVRSVADYEHHTLVSEVFEITREVYGYKPNWGALNAMSDDELEAELESLTRSAELEREAEAKQQARNVEKFEQRVQETIAMGAGNRETAIKWIMEAEDVERGYDELRYVLDLPDDYFQEAA